MTEFLEKIKNILFLILLNVVICAIFLHITRVKEVRYVKVDLLQISNEYTQKAVLMVTKNTSGLTREEKMANAKTLISRVATILTTTLETYSKKNHVVILQDQAIATDIGYPIQDITKDIEKDIDKQLGQE